MFQFLDKETKGGNCRAVTYRMQEAVVSPLAPASLAKMALLSKNK